MRKVGRVMVLMGEDKQTVEDAEVRGVVCVVVVVVVGSEGRNGKRMAGCWWGGAGLETVWEVVV